MMSESVQASSMQTKLKPTVSHRNPPGLLYHYSYSFADDFSAELVQRLVGRKINKVNCASSGRWYAKYKRRILNYLGRIEALRRPRLLALGSIFQFARHGDIVWGTGVNPRWQKRLPEGTVIDIRAVRGPLTRDYVVSRLGHECPAIYGDPGLLFPALFPEFKREERKELTIILQHFDENLGPDVQRMLCGHIPYICQRSGTHWREIVREIVASKFVIASSLHAIILAESYGIPARWLHNKELPSAKTEGTFKYNDYLASTGREPDLYAANINEALDLGGMPRPDLSLVAPLREAFPLELWNS